MLESQIRYQNAIANDHAAQGVEDFTYQGLEALVKEVDGVLTAYQRTSNRFGFARRPDAEEIQADIASTLRALTGSLDVIGYAVGYHV